MVSVILDFRDRHPDAAFVLGAIVAMIAYCVVLGAAEKIL